MSPPSHRRSTTNHHRGQAARSPSQRFAAGARVATPEPDQTTRESILEAATALMSQRGFAATSINSICTATGLTAPTIYWHFGSKDGLLAAVVARSVDAWYHNLEVAMAESDPSVGPATLYGALDRFVDLIKASFRSKPEALRLMLWLGMDLSGPNHEVRRVIQQARQRAVDRLADTLAHFVPGGTEALDAACEHLARILIVHLDGIFVAHAIDDDTDRLDELFASARTAVTAVGIAIFTDAAKSRTPANDPIGGDHDNHDR